MWRDKSLTLSFRSMFKLTRASHVMGWVNYYLLRFEMPCPQLQTIFDDKNLCRVVVDIDPILEEYLIETETILLSWLQ